MIVIMPVIMPTLNLYTVMFIVALDMCLHYFEFVYNCAHSCVGYMFERASLLLLSSPPRNYRAFIPLML